MSLMVISPQLNTYMRSTLARVVGAELAANASGAIAAAEHRANHLSRVCMAVLLRDSALSLPAARAADYRFTRMP
jgi:hypothetical protein